MKRGKCTNYGECDDANKIFDIEDGQPFECPTCHEKLKEVDANGKPISSSSQKKKGKKGGINPLFIIIGCVVIGLIVAAIIIFAPNKEDEIVEPVVNDLPLDSIQPEEQVIPNRNDTLVIKVEGLENTRDSITQSEEPIIEEAPVEEVIPEEPVKEPVQSSSTTTVQTTKPTTATSSQTTSHKLSYGTWTGGWKNGQPHGTGTMTYSTSHTIDSRDTKGRVAQPGEYIVGEWDNGHLVQGRWFKKDGTKEAVIIGKAG